MFDLLPHDCCISLLSVENRFVYHERQFQWRIADQDLLT